MRPRVILFVGVVFLVIKSASIASAQDCDGNGIDDAVELANAQTRIRALTPPVGDGSEQQEKLGAAVDIDGEIAILGAPNNRQQFAPGGELFQGRAVVYRRASGQWGQEQVLFSDQMPFTRQFGRHVAINGDVAVVGAFSQLGTPTDRLFVFRFTNGNWSMEADIVLPGRFTPSNDFGRAVDISGNVIVVGMVGIVQFYEFQNNSWQATDSFNPDNPFSQGAFSSLGRSIAIDGDTAVVSAENYFEGRLGGAIVLKEFAAGWEPVQLLRDALSKPEGDFGVSVDIDGDRIVVGGAPSGNFPLTRAVVYKKQVDGRFQFEQRFEAPDLSVTQDFGSEVRICGNRIAVYFSSSFNRTARIFELSGGAWYHVGDFAGSTADAPAFPPFHRDIGSGMALTGDGLIVANDGLGVPDAPDTWGDATIYDLSATDCDGDGELDRCALFAADSDGDGQSTIDCDANARLDSCELAERDCNGNGILDECDLGLINGNAISDDCNEDLIPDECQFAEMDCDSNGTLDMCDLELVVHLLDIPVGDNDLDRADVDIDGNTLVVSLPRYDDLNQDEGRVFIYERQNTRWTIKQVLNAPSKVEFGNFGYDVSISGDLLAISQPKFANEFGSGSQGFPEIYIFRRVNDWWEFDAVLTSLDVVPGGNGALDLGFSIDLKQGRLVSSATLPVSQSRQVAVVFERIDGQGWVIDNLLDENQAPSDSLPWRSITVDQVGDTVLASATKPGTPRNSMAAVFRRTESGYQQTAYITNPDFANDLNFGRGRLLSEDRLVVQSRTQSTMPEFFGGLYLYRRDGESWTLSDSILNTPANFLNGGNTIAAGIDDLVIAEGFAAAFDILGDRFRRRLDNQFAQLALLTPGISVGPIEQDGTNLVFATNFPFGGNNPPRVQVGVAPLFAPLDCNRNNLPDTCDAAGDLNGDLAITLDDIPGFVDRLLTNSYCSLADINSDDAVDGRDIGPFVSALAMP